MKISRLGPIILAVGLLTACGAVTPVWGADKTVEYLETNFLPMLQQDFEAYSNVCDLYDADPTAAYSTLDKTATEADNFGLDREATLDWMDKVCNDPEALL